MAADTTKIQDSILLRRARHDKDRKALGQLNILYYPRIKCYIASRVNLTEDAEDANSGWVGAIGEVYAYRNNFVIVQITEGNPNSDDGEFAWFTANELEAV